MITFSICLIIYIISIFWCKNVLPKIIDLDNLENKVEEIELIGKDNYVDILSWIPIENTYAAFCATWCLIKNKREANRVLRNIANDNYENDNDTQSIIDQLASDDEDSKNNPIK